MPDARRPDVPADPAAPSRIPAALIAPEAAAAGFTVVGTASLADLGDRAGERFRAFLDLGRHGDMDWLASASRAAPPPASAVARGALGDRARPQLRARPTIRWPCSPSRSAARSPVYAQGRDYHDIVKPRLKRVAGALQRRQRRRRQGVRRYRAADGEAAGRGSPASAGRASTPTSSRAGTAPGCSSAPS